MTRKEYEQIEMLQRVVNFGATRPDLFPKNSGGQCFSSLGESLARVSEQVQVLGVNRGAFHGNTDLRVAARENLRKQLQRISLTAVAIAVGSPGVDKQFRYPRRNRDAALLDAAGSFAMAARPLKKEFIQHQMPSSFIEDLNGAAEGLNEAVITHSVRKKSRASAEAGAVQALGNCLKLLRRVDAVVVNTIGDDVPLMAEWLNTRRIVTRSRSKGASADSSASQRPAESTTDPPTT